jgi:RND family efflux transporter MFP subunit
LNSTLEAVPESNYDVTATISGTYTGTTEGEYAISIYPTSSGYSFTANKGGNTWSGAVSTNPTALGNEGLYIAFSSVTRLSGNEKWTVKMPNTKAANYLAYYNAYQTALTSRQTAVNAATSALESAESALALTKAGATAEQIKSQEAVVEQAQATVENITVQLNKTIIRSPISGTVSSLSAKYGELIGAGQSIASIVNQSGLQIKSYVSDKDLPLIEKGAAVIINGNVKGEVSRLSPSVNASTKTAEVNIIVSEPENSGLIVGQNATVKIAEKTEGGETSIYELPLQAVKVTDSSAYVYQVVNSTLEEKQVTIGQVDGEFIEIKSGLDENMQIVSTVYELRNGQKVNIEE